MQFHRKLTIGVLLAVCTLVVYWPAHQFEFVNYDDNRYVTQNEHVQRGLTWSGIRWAFTTNYFSTWHPVTWLSYMLDYEFYRLAPTGYHLTNVGLHALNAVLLFALLDWLTGSTGRSVFVAALFALHPLNVQSVAWVSERKNVLSTLFWILALLAYTCYARRSQLRMLALGVALFAVSLMAKPMLAPGAALLLLLDIWPLGRFSAPIGTTPPGIRRIVLEKVPFLALGLAASVVTLWARQAETSGPSWPSIPLVLRIENALVAYCTYIGKMFWPTDLASFYPYPDQIPLGHAAACGVMLFTVTALVLAYVRRFPYLAVGWVWYLVSLLPVIGVIKLSTHAMADRYCYVPLIGIFVMVSWGAVELFSAVRGSRAILAAVAMMILLALAVSTRHELVFWKDSITLRARAAAVLNHDSYAQNDFGVALAERNRHEEAIDSFRRAIALAPDHAPEHRNLAMSLAVKSRFDESAVHFAQALLIQPGDPETLRNFVSVLTVSGRLSDAQRRYPEAFHGQPDRIRALRDLARALASHPEPSVRDGAEAVRLAEQAVQLSEGREAETLDALGVAYAETSRYGDAVAVAEEAATAATAVGKRDLAVAIQQRIDLYRRGLPFRD